MATLKTNATTNIEAELQYKLVKESVYSQDEIIRMARTCLESYEFPESDFRTAYEKEYVNIIKGNWSGLDLLPLAGSVFEIIASRILEEEDKVILLGDYLYNLIFDELWNKLEKELGYDRLMRIWLDKRFKDSFYKRFDRDIWQKFIIYVKDNERIRELSSEDMKNLKSLIVEHYGKFGFQFGPLDLLAFPARDSWLLKPFYLIEVKSSRRKRNVSELLSYDQKQFILENLDKGGILVMYIFYSDNIRVSYYEPVRN